MKGIQWGSQLVLYSTQIGRQLAHGEKLELLKKLRTQRNDPEEITVESEP